MLFGLNNGELFVIGFITLAVISAPWWPRLGGAIAVKLAGGEERARDRDNGAK